MKPGQLVLCICNNHAFMPDAFFWSYIKLLKPAGSFAVKGNHSVKAAAYNQAVAQALQLDAEWMLLMDVDQTFPQNTIQRLLETAKKHDAKIVSVLYHLGRPPYPPVAGWIKRQGDEDAYVNSAGHEWRDNYAPLGDGVVEVDWVGTGGLLVHREVIDKMWQPNADAPFMDTWHQHAGIRKLGHDMNFCARAKALGYKILVDTSVVSGHGKFVYVDSPWADAYTNSQMGAHQELALHNRSLTADYWDNVWQTEHLKNAIRSEVYEDTHKKLLELIPEGAKVADVGCGPGALMEILRDQKKCDCTGYDFSGQAIDIVRKKGFKGKVADFRNFSVNGESGTFDVVLSTHTIEHIEDDKQFVGLLKQMTKRGGKVILATPSNEAIQGHFEHVRGYTDAEMDAFMGSLFPSFVVCKNNRDYVAVGNVE